MQVFSYPIYTLNQTAVPLELQGHMSPPVWQDIVTKSYMSRGDGDGLACCFEWMVCLFTGFFCIFFCHRQIAECMSGNDNLQTERELNYRYFAGAYVVQIIGVSFKKDMKPFQTTTIVE